METIRDSAFGKLVRIFSGGRLLKYPEELDPCVWTDYLRTEPKLEREPTETGSDDESDNFGLYTVMSQVSRCSRRLPSAHTSQNDGIRNGTPIVIDWSGPNDSEVRPSCEVH